MTHDEHDALAVVGRDALPVGVERLGQLLDDLRILPDDVGPLAGIVHDVVQFRGVDQPPALRHCHGIGPLCGLKGPLQFDAQGPGGQGLFRFEELLLEAATVEVDAFGRRQAAEVYQGRQDVEMGVQVPNVRAVGELARRPVDEKGHAMAPFIDRALVPSHTRVEQLHPGGPAVVRHEDQYGVVCQPLVGQGLAEQADAPVYALDAREEVGDPRVDFGRVLRGPRLVRDRVGRMGNVGVQVDEEGLLVGPGLDEVDRGTEMDLGGIALSLFPLAVVEVAIVDAVVGEVVIARAGAAVALSQPFVKAAIHRSVGVVRPKVPFAEHPRAVA